jgi:hypothetical protein
MPFERLAQKFFLLGEGEGEGLCCNSWTRKIVGNRVSKTFVGVC